MSGLLLLPRQHKKSFFSWMLYICISSKMKCLFLFLQCRTLFASTHWMPARNKTFCIAARLIRLPKDGAGREPAGLKVITG